MTRTTQSARPQQKKAEPHPPAKLTPLRKWHTSQGGSHEWPEPNRWKQLLRRREQNGLDSAVIKVGNELLIDEAAFLAWIESHREGGVR